ncbi:MAG: hypothetical protein P8Y25_00885 [Chromatiaceae bacterium]
MLKPSLFAACLTLLLASPLAAPVQARADGHPIAPRLAGLGTHHHPITAASPEAQRFFDQGLILSFGFNHREAARSFRQAQALDPACAMCYWGEALVLGPNINARMDAADNPRAYEAVQRALALAAQVSAPERAYIAQPSLPRRGGELHRGEGEGAGGLPPHPRPPGHPAHASAGLRHAPALLVDALFCLGAFRAVG